MINILITSGGTSVPIDPVRYITNTSSGRFGAAIATEALKAGMQVDFLTSVHGQSPFSLQIDFFHSPDWHKHSAQIQRLSNFADKHREHYKEHRYQYFNEYAAQLQALISKQKPDIVVLAAAVSDYLVANYSDQKVRSNHALDIQLKQAPKLINSVRQWSPKSIIAGFKLLANANDTELVNAAKNSIQQHDLDLCVANDLSSLKRGSHEIIIVDKDGSAHHVKHDLAAAVIASCTKRMSK